MARVFNTNLNSSLNPDFFKFKNVPQPKYKTLESVKASEKVLTTNKHYKDVPMFYEGSLKENYAAKVLGKIQEVSPFSCLFFSQKNIDEIQRLIRYNVYIYSSKKHIIGNQDHTELLIVMRSQYLQYANIPSDPKDYKNEIEKINGLVVTAILPNIISNIEQYIGYLKDSTTNYIPIDRGVNTSITGEKTLRSTSDVLVGDNKFFASAH